MSRKSLKVGAVIRLAVCELVLCTVFLVPSAYGAQFSKKQAKELEKLLKTALLEKAEKTFRARLDNDTDLELVSHMRLLMSILENRCLDVGYSYGFGQHQQGTCALALRRAKEIKLDLVRMMALGYYDYISELRIEAVLSPGDAKSLLDDLKAGNEAERLSRLTEFSLPVKWTPTRAGCATRVELGKEGKVLLSYWLLFASEQRKRINGEQLEVWEKELANFVHEVSVTVPPTMATPNTETRPDKLISRKTESSERTLQAPTSTPQEGESGKSAQFRQTNVSLGFKRMKFVDIGLCAGVSEYAYGKLFHFSLRSRAVPPFKLEQLVPESIPLDGIDFSVFSEIGYGSTATGGSGIHDLFWSAGLKAKFVKLASLPVGFRIGVSGYEVSENSGRPEMSLSRTAGLAALLGGSLEIYHASRVAVEIGVDFVAAKRLGNTQMWVFVGGAP